MVYRLYTGYPTANGPIVGRITCGTLFVYWSDQSRADASRQPPLAEASIKKAGKNGSKHPDLDLAPIVQGDMVGRMAQQLSRPARTPCGLAIGQLWESPFHLCLGDGSLKPIHRGRSSSRPWRIWLDGGRWWRTKILMKGRPRCMGGEGLWKETVMCIQLLPEDLVIIAEVPEQDWRLLLPVLPALAADDRGETARQDLDTVNNMA